MELPHLGKNCALKECNQLDFLPVKCDVCSEVFCVRHYKYDTHNCLKAQSKNVQVPVCPLCSEPVANRRGQLPDIAVSQHIDQYCKRNEQIKDRNNKPKTNLQACTFKSCKQKDLIYLECSDCKGKFCIKHRHSSDHSCPGPSMAANLAVNWQSFKGSCSNSASTSFETIRNKAQQISRSGQAALNRIAGSNTGQSSSSRASGQSVNNTVGKLQGNLTEQEALAIALNESKANGKARTVTSQEEEDQALARALHESQMEARGRSVNSNSKDNCVVS